MSVDDHEVRIESDLLPWQDGAWARLVDIIGDDRCPHALMLHGPAGIGKRSLATRLAIAILCAEDPPAVVPCDTCRSCHLARVGNHPGLVWIEPDEKGGISIDNIRDLRARSNLTAQGTRVAIVAPAENMNPPAMNAFLKTLEEPAGRTIFILVSHAPGRLPATIRSRCWKAALPAPSRADALVWLETRTDNAPLLLELGGGMPLTALEFGRSHEDEKLRSLHGATQALLRGGVDPLRVAEQWSALGDRELVLATVFAALNGFARDPGTVSDPDRLFETIDDVVGTRREWLEVSGLAEQLVFEGLALRCAGAAA